MFKKNMFSKLSWMLYLLIGLLVLSSYHALAQEAPTYNSKGKEKIGVLVIAHGSSEADWNQPVRDAAKDVNSLFPVEIGFLEFSPDEDIPTAIQKLEAQGVERIVAVPIFIASASGHIEEIKYILGLPSSITPEEAVEEGLEPTPHSAAIELTPALDDHFLVAGILNDRIASVSRQANQEVAVLAAHGTSKEQDLAVWKNNLASLGQQLKTNHGFLEVKYGFVAVGEPGLRLVVEEQQRAHPNASIIVMPVMLSEGTFTSNKIPSMLNGLEYVYPQEGDRSLLPHNNISHFIAARANDAVLGSLHWAEDIIREMMKDDVITGYPDNTFRPNNTITRAEFVTLLIKVLKLTPHNGNVFSDTAGHWAKDYISIAAEAGIVKGYGTNGFGPDDPITREQIAVMIAKTTGISSSGETNFVDYQQISDWAKEAVAIVSAHEIIMGYPDKSFRPQNWVTRAEAASILFGIQQLINSK